MNRWYPTAVLAVVLVTGAGAWAAGSSSTGLPAVGGVVSVTPAGPLNCIAAELLLGDGQSLVGLRWYNNDAGTVFPRVVIVPTTEAGEPGALDAGYAFDDVVAGRSSAWCELEFPDPIVSDAGAVCAVFVLPPFAAREDDGEGGGPGLGFRTQEGAGGSFISWNGGTWVRTGCSFAIEPVYGQAAGGAFALSRRQAGGELSGAEPLSGVDVPLIAVPNPFNPATEIAFSLAVPGQVRLGIYDLRGALVATLVTGELAAGTHSARWDGLDASSRPAPSGLYIARLQAGGRVRSERLCLIR